MEPDDPIPTDGMNTDICVRLEQIAKISHNARTSWFSLLALLVFVGVTLMGQRDSDFFAFGAEFAGAQPDRLFGSVQFSIAGIWWF